MIYAIFGIILSILTILLNFVALLYGGLFFYLPIITCICSIFCIYHAIKISKKRVDNDN